MAENEPQGIRVRIALQPGENAVRFPNCCVYCGQPATRAHRLRVRKQQQVGEARGLFALRTFVESSARMAVPYCGDHFAAAWLDKWILGGVTLVAQIAGMRFAFYLGSRTFLVKGDFWPYILFTAAVMAGAALAVAARWIVRAAIGLVFPAMRDLPPLPNLQMGSGKHLLGIQVRMSMTQLDLILNNPQVAEAVRQLNAGVPGAAAGIEVWQEPDEAPASSPAVDSSTPSRPAATRRPIGGWIAIAVGGLIIVGTLVFWLLGVGRMGLQQGLPEQAVSLACMTTLVCVVPAVTVGGILLAAGLSRVLRHRRGGGRELA